MSPEQIFSLCGALATAGWLLLVFLPRWRWTARLVCPVVIPTLLALVYLWLVATTFGRTPGGFGSLAEVSLLFRNPRALLAGWIHYLAFDLFIGSWEVRDARRVGLRHLLVVPCLVLTFLFGPVGLLLYFALRAGLRRGLAVGDAA
ncbi:MAG TPA: ABA4-like family protein [Pyrinomonadaceae bacterium]|nr:ABA4-like family protein [Pyrinomonadaceae bacterium]